MNILGIDPGVMTGYCFAELDQEQKIISIRPSQLTDDVDDLYRRLFEIQPRHIIIEDFEFRQKSRVGLNLFPVQLIGVTRLYGLTAQTQCAVHVQKASIGKAYYTDTLLKANGLYVRGVPHGLDAMRHLLHWMTFGSGYQYNEDLKFQLAK